MTIARLQALRSEPGMLKQAAVFHLRAVEVGDGTTVNIVSETPAALAQAAGVPLETFSRACNIAAEGYGGDPIGRAAAAVIIGQTIDNVRGSTTVTGKLTHSVFLAARGFYGEQRGRFAATTRPPTFWDLEVAKAIEANDVPDLAAGAVHYLDPHNYVGGKQNGRDLGPFQTRMDAWIRNEGNELCPPVATVDPFFLVALRPGGTPESRNADFNSVLDMFERGKLGDHGPNPGDPDSNPLLLAALVGAGLLGMAWAAGLLPRWS